MKDEGYHLLTFQDKRKYTGEFLTCQLILY